MQPIDPFDPAFLDDPYPTYTRLRDDDPIHRAATGMWVLSRYDDVLGALRDPSRFSSSPMNAGEGAGFKFLIGSDPPDHTTLRRLVNRPFHPAAIKAMEPRIREIAEEMVDGLLAARGAGEEQSPADLVEHLAFPLPVIVIAELLGIPIERRADFKRWSDAMIGGLSPDSDRNKQALAAMEMFAYFNEVIAERREAPGDDLISLLVTGTEPLSNQELLMFCMLLLVAGNETTTNLLSNLTLVLTNRPDVQEALRADPARIRDAIEETLRFDAPVQSLWRRTTTDIDLHGVTVPAGEQVVVLFASANRDDRRYEAPAEFRLDRYTGIPVPDHVGFGGGIHHCLGAPLARLEARVAIETLLARTSWLAPAGDGDSGQRLHNVLVRGMARLPLAVEVAAA